MARMHDFTNGNIPMEEEATVPQMQDRANSSAWGLMLRIFIPEITGIG